MWSRRYTRCRTVENDVVPDNCVGDCLDAFAGVPDDIAFDDVDAFAAAVHENARIFGADIRVMDDIVADDVAVRAEFYFDAVVAAAAGAAGVMDIIALDESVGGYTRAVMATDVHTFTFGRAVTEQTGMVDVVSSDNKGVAVAAVHCQSVVQCITDLTIFECNVVTPDKSYAGAAALEIDSADSEIFAIDELDIVVSGCDLLRMCEHWFLVFDSTNCNGRLSGALGGDGPPGGL